MKDLLLYLLLCMAALFSGFQLVDLVIEENVIEADIINNKTGAVYSFEIPQKYLSKNGAPLIPIEVTLTATSKIPVYEKNSLSLEINLPNSLSGNFLLELRIGKHYSSRIIQL